MLKLLDQNAAIDTRLWFFGQYFCIWNLIQITHEQTLKLRFDFNVTREL